MRYYNGPCLKVLIVLTFIVCLKAVLGKKCRTGNLGVGGERLNSYKLLQFGRLHVLILEVCLVALLKKFQSSPGRYSCLKWP